MPFEISTGAPPFAGSSKERLQAYEKRLVLEAYEQAGGNQAQAARSLGLSFAQFRRYYHKHSAATGGARRKAPR